jgi:hypothetical protein
MQSFCIEERVTDKNCSVTRCGSEKQRKTSKKAESQVTTAFRFTQGACPNFPGSFKSCECHSASFELFRNRKKKQHAWGVLRLRDAEKTAYGPETDRTSATCPAWAQSPLLPSGCQAQLETFLIYKHYSTIPVQARVTVTCNTVTM